MKTRFLKAISVPVVLVLLIPIVVLSTIYWVLFNKYSIDTLAIKYFEWIDKPTP